MVAQVSAIFTLYITYQYRVPMTEQEQNNNAQEMEASELTAGQPVVAQEAPAADASAEANTTAAAPESSSADATTGTIEAATENSAAASGRIQAIVEITEETPASEKRREERERRKKLEEEIASELEKAQADGTLIEVQVTERIKGGLRLDYKGVRLFMPGSHFSLRAAAAESDLEAAVGKPLTVTILEAQKDEKGRRTYVASRRQQIKEQLMGNLNTGDTVEGIVTSVRPFGVFVDLNGIEGMVHISRIANFRIGDPSQYFKTGDKVKASITSIDKAKGKISLSTKDFMVSPWEEAESRYPIGAVVKGTVSHFSEFGTYIQIEPGIEGLLRNADLSWGRRSVTPQDLMQIGAAIDVVVLSVSGAKKRIGLSLKHLRPNPWKTIHETHPIGTIINTTVIDVSNPKGLLVQVNEDLDGFVPRSRVKNVPGKSSFSVGDAMEAIVIDSDGEKESLVLAPNYSEEELSALPQGGGRGERGDRGDRGGRGDRGRDRNDSHTANLPQTPSITLMDLLSDKQRSSLKND